MLARRGNQSSTSLSRATSDLDAISPESLEFQQPSALNLGPEASIQGAAQGVESVDLTGWLAVCLPACMPRCLLAR